MFSKNISFEYQLSLTKSNNFFKNLNKDLMLTEEIDTFTIKNEYMLRLKIEFIDSLIVITFILNNI